MEIFFYLLIFSYYLMNGSTKLWKTSVRTCRCLSTHNILVNTNPARIRPKYFKIEILNIHLTGILISSLRNCWPIEPDHPLDVQDYQIKHKLLLLH